MVKKVTKTDWKRIILGLVATILILYARFRVTGAIDWGYILDTLAVIFGVGLLLIILEEIFGTRIISKFK